MGDCGFVCCAHTLIPCCCDARPYCLTLKRFLQLRGSLTLSLSPSSRDTFFSTPATRLPLFSCGKARLVTPGERAPEIFRRPIVVALRGLATGFFLSLPMMPLSPSLSLSPKPSLLDRFLINWSTSFRLNESKLASQPPVKT